MCVSRPLSVYESNYHTLFDLDLVHCVLLRLVSKRYLLKANRAPNKEEEEKEEEVSK